MTSTWAHLKAEDGTYDLAAMDERGMMPGTTHRMEVAFAVGEPWTNDRIMLAMAHGLGAVYTYEKVAT